jgi:ribitol 2-dehydrogenase
MARELEGKVAVVSGAGSGIGLASTEAMLAAGSRVMMVDRDEVALKSLCKKKHGHAVIQMVIDLLDPKDCATLLPRVLEKVGQPDPLHANAGTYVGGDLVDSETGAIDRMLNLNVNVVMKNVHDVLPHMIERRTGDITVTSSLAAHFPTPWEPVYALPLARNDGNISPGVLHNPRRTGALARAHHCLKRTVHLIDI